MPNEHDKLDELEKAVHREPDDLTPAPAEPDTTLSEPVLSSLELPEALEPPASLGPLETGDSLLNLEDGESAASPLNLADDHKTLPQAAPGMAPTLSTPSPTLNTSPVEEPVSIEPELPASKVEQPDQEIAPITASTTAASNEPTPPREKGPERLEATPSTPAPLLNQPAAPPNNPRRYFAWCGGCCGCLTLAFFATVIALVLLGSTIEDDEPEYSQPASLIESRWVMPRL